MNNLIEVSGHVYLTIDYATGEQEKLDFKNQVLRLGRNALANVLTNNVSAAFNLYISRMIFGTNGTMSGTPREVEDTRTGLFGPVLLNKPVISNVNQSLPSQAIFTSVIAFNEAVGSSLSEMALLTADGNLFSMVTFGDVTKGSNPLSQLTFNWEIMFV